MAGASKSLGGRQDPYHGFNFKVEIQGLTVAGFREVRGLESTLDVKDHVEGGLNGYTHKFPGKTEYSTLTLSRGLSDCETLWAWYLDVSAGIIERRNVTIRLRDAKQTDVMFWVAVGALPVKWIGPTFNATQSTEIAVESVDLVHRGIQKLT